MKPSFLTLSFSNQPSLPETCPSWEVPQLCKTPELTPNHPKNPPKRLGKSLAPPDSPKRSLYKVVQPNTSSLGGGRELEQLSSRISANPGRPMSTKRGNYCPSTSPEEAGGFPATQQLAMSTRWRLQGGEQSVSD